MKNSLALFPLNLVAYPNEDLNLHIFEPRYRQLVNECLETGKTFGIPAFVDGKLMGYGTEMKVTNLEQKYDGGQMDVNTKGVRAFRLTSFENPMPKKLYAGGTVVFLEQANEYKSPSFDLLDAIAHLYELLGAEAAYDISQPYFSYQVAHKIGLSLADEYKLLTIFDEVERQAFLADHLEKSIPVLAEMERTKERIKMNGHFKNLDTLDF